MKLEKLVSDRFKERPADCVIDSHALMLRGGYIKQVGNGIFSSYSIMRRIEKKIEAIIRDEMDAIDGQEVKFPVVMPASLWEESGRFESIGSELLRFVDRNETPMLLGMTHEEAAVHLVREYGQTYAKYPFMIYQIQTKFRDEARPRAGLIRTREFIMKDAYSYHLTQADLESYYAEAHKAYERIFKRAGLKDVISVESDNGMMGGKVSHEFMLLTEVGEDSIVLCRACNYSANMESAECVVKNENIPVQPLTKVHTPGYKTIEEVNAFLNRPVSTACKAVVYQKAKTGDYVVFFIRGDLEVNEAKLNNYVMDELIPATIDENSGITAGYLGPADLKNAEMFFDRSLDGIYDLCIGANEVDYHYIGFNMMRDLGSVEYIDFAKAYEGGICPKCGQHSLELSRGIEVGNIFQLGDKYTRSMEMKYTDENGVQQYPIMGCYGIGVGRLAASVAEESHDDYGPHWPISIAPWQVHLCCMKSKDEDAKALSDQLYTDLKAAGLEVIYDDRNVSPGVMFSDADLIGCPIRIIVSPRNITDGVVEVKTRDKSVDEKIPNEQVISYVNALKSTLFAQLVE